MTGKISKPPYIELCFDILKKKCSDTYNIKILDNKTILNYISDLRKDINRLPLALKADYIRIALLYKYGGIWIDADTIVMTDIHEIIDKLNEGWDFVGFRCNGMTRQYYYIIKKLIFDVIILNKY